VTPSEPERTTPAVYAQARRGLLTTIADPVAAWARRRRHEVYRRLIAPQPGETVVDIGCGPAGTGLAALEPEAPITGVDAANRPGYAQGPRSFVQADARALPFEDDSFAIAHSSSVIEHVDPVDRPRFAAELRRVTGRYIVQTPNRWFPSKDLFQDIRLLDSAELRRLFPDAVIVRERFFGLTKSLIAVGPATRLSYSLSA
jgi:SAM-dependent methyltransferase